MDPFAEKELIDNLRSIAISLRNMDRKMDDMTLSLRELAASENDKDDIDNSVEKEEISDNQPCTKY
ncbi:MAG: hypothetical protein AABX17_03830 [Nanoarchaeota archaeon]